VAARVARAPEADPLRVDGVVRLEEADGAPPVGDLAPRVDVLARQPVAGAEAAVVVQQDDEAAFAKASAKGSRPCSFTPA
jgi:hypothetical protein